MIHTSQTTKHILMVRPANFGFNKQTALNNTFQTLDSSLAPDEIQGQAIEEFDAFVGKLTENGVRVLVVEDTAKPVKPDAVFPNNWVSFHDDGTIVTFPMFAPSRRKERRDDVLNMLGKSFFVDRRLQLERSERRKKYLEGTGSMVLDRVNRIAYACLSPRTNSELLEKFCREMQYTSISFRALDGKGVEIYHTNVMMAIGDSFVVICMDTILDDSDKETLLTSFEKNKKEVIEINLEQMLAFAGNMLQIENDRKEKLIVMSEQAFQCLDADQIECLEKYGKLVHSPIDTIETYGGGSARCMLAEVFLPEVL